MASLGATAYVGTLNADTINYTTLNPALTGFVHNPMNSDLDGDNRNITNVNELTTTQLNYTTLNPAINPGVTNPLGADLDGDNRNITNVNEITATSGTFTNSTLGTAGCGALTATDAISGTSISLSGNAGCNGLTATSVNTSTLTTTGNSTLGAVVSIPNTLSVKELTGPGSQIELVQSITAIPGSSVIITAPQIVATSLITSVGAQLGPGGLNSAGGIICANVISNGRLKTNNIQIEPRIWDCGTTLNLGTTNTDNSLYFLITTTTGSILPGTGTITFPDADLFFEGLIAEFDGSGLNPATGGGTFPITITYTSKLVNGGGIQTQTLNLSMTGTTFGRLRVKRDSNQRLNWTPDT